MNKEKIKELEEEISEAKRKIDELTAKLEKERNVVDITDRWKPALGIPYYTSGTDDFASIRWDSDDFDNHTFNSFDTWETVDRAKEVYEKIKTLRIMEQIHDILCPDYKPDWNNCWEIKWYCYYNSSQGRWNVGRSVYYVESYTYFDAEHAEQACEILNDMGIIPA